MSVKAVNAGISVYRDFVESVKRRPLKEGVERLVTVANDNVKRTLGRNSEFIYLETKII